MPKLTSRLPCPVCLGVAMHKVTVGAGPTVEVDLCGRCGGIWLEQGEVQALRANPYRDARIPFDRTTAPQLSQCQNCHAPLNRDAAECPACGHQNVIGCPHCDRTMQVLWRGPLRLDVCRHCKGTWFDHHELEALWGPQFDLALQRRNLQQGGVATIGGDVADIALHSLFYSPDLMLLGGSLVGDVAGATASVLAQLPEAVAASPEAATTVFEVLADAAGGVFEVVVEIVSGIFS